MIRILDLFAGTQSVRKAITEKYNIVNWEYDENTGIWKGNSKPYLQNDVEFYPDYEIEYIGIDIYSPEGKNILLDLAQKHIVDKLDAKLNGWKPDFIWASPVCNKFSAATTGPGGNTYFIIENNNLREREREEYKFVKHNKFNEKPERWDEFVKEAKLAMKLHNNVREIINYFNVPFAIENPANALTKHIYKDYVRNVCHYSAYGFEYKKPTAIYSSKNIYLKKGLEHESQRIIRFDRINKTNNWPNHWDKKNSTYANRSSVPPKLISSILDSLLQQTKTKETKMEKEKSQYLKDNKENSDHYRKELYGKN